MKIANSTHRKITKLSKAICFIVFIIAIAMATNMGINNYKSASEIMSDPIFVNAELKFEGITEETGRKNKTKNMYNFKYNFSASGKDLNGAFTVSENNSEEYLKSSEIKIAYLKSNPEKFDRFSVVEDASKKTNLIRNLVIAFLGSAFVTFLLHILITGVFLEPKDEEITEEKNA